TTHFSVDSHGYRGGFDAQDPRPRVLVLGGSTAFGFGLENDDQLVTARLEAALPRFQFINAAVVGFLSGQELSELVHRAADIHPRIVIALDGFNDVYVPILAATRFPMRGVGLGFNWDIFALVEGRLRSFTTGAAGDLWPRQAREPVDEMLQRIAREYATNL